MLGLGTGIEYYNLSEELPYDLATNSDLTIWLKFDTGITESSGAVSQWDDSSGNLNHATNSKASSQPTYSGGKLIFDGNKVLNFATRNDASFTAICALDLDETATLSNEILIGNNTGGWAIKLYRASGADDVGLRVNGNTAEAGSATSHVDKQLSTGNLSSGKFLFTTTYNGTNGAVTFRVNAQSAATGTFGGSTFNAFRLEQMGSGGLTAGQVNADIYEFAYYTSVLSSDDLGLAENAIMSRVGIS